MHYSALMQLRSSLASLEAAIGTALCVADAKGGSADVRTHLLSYVGVVRKQRALSCALEAELDAGNWKEVRRYLEIINGLSKMIRDDAQAVITSFLPQSQTPEEALLH